MSGLVVKVLPNGPPRHDLTGHVYGFLKVVAALPFTNVKGQALWLVYCHDCTGFAVSTARTLKRGAKMTCGCTRLRPERHVLPYRHVNHQKRIRLSLDQRAKRTKIRPYPYPVEPRIWAAKVIRSISTTSSVNA